MSLVDKTVKRESFKLLPTDALVEPSHPLRVEPTESLEELVESIKASGGILEPIIVRPRKDGFYEVVAGHRRYLAAKKAGLAHVPAVIRELDDVEATLVALTENIQRREMSDYEVAKVLKFILDKTGVSQRELAKKLGKHESWVSHHLKMLELEKLVARQVLTKLSEYHARVLLSTPEGVRVVLARMVEDFVAKSGRPPSVRLLKRWVRELTSKPGVKRDKLHYSRDRERSSRVESRVYEPRGKHDAQPRRSSGRLGELVWSQLVRYGVQVELRKPIPVRYAVPDLWIPGEPPLAVYLDDSRREEVELLTERGVRVLKVYCKDAREAVDSILEALGLKARRLAELLLQEARRDMFNNWGRVVLADFQSIHQCSPADIEKAVEHLKEQGYEVRQVGGVVRIYLAAPAGLVCPAEAGKRLRGSLP